MPYMIKVLGEKHGFLQRKISMSGYRRTQRAIVPIEEGSVFPDSGSAVRSWRAAQRYGKIGGQANLVEVAVTEVFETRLPHKPGKKR